MTEQRAPRKKRWQVISYAPNRPPICVTSKDLRSEAELFIARQHTASKECRRDNTNWPHLELVDGYEQRRGADAENQAAD